MELTIEVINFNNNNVDRYQRIGDNDKRFMYAGQLKQHF